MNNLRTAAQQALEACEQRLPLKGQAAIIDELNALRAALAEPATLDEAMAGPRALAQAYENGWNAAKAEQGEPVAWYLPSPGGDDSIFRDHRTVKACTGNKWEGFVPLYTAPPHHKPLTEKEITNIFADVLQSGTFFDVARAIEAAHGIKP